MKTTFDLPESLVHDVKRIARERGTTARALVQQALTTVIEESKEIRPFTLRDASVSAWHSKNLELPELSMNDLIRMSHNTSSDNNNEG